MTPEEKEKACAQVNNLVAGYRLPLTDALGILELVKFKMIRDANEKRPVIRPPDKQQPT
jgi:hypothetical protein